MSGQVKTPRPPTRDGRGSVIAPGSVARCVLAGTSAVAALASAILFLSMLDTPSGLCSPGCLERRLSALMDASGDLRTGQFSEAEGLIRRELAFSAFDDTAWLRQAALETTRAGRLDAAAVRALEASYRVAPVDVDMARWRLVFLFQHWSEVSPQSRLQAGREMTSLAVAPENIPGLKALGQKISNPSGRLAFQLMSDQLGAR
jgi:hypothetical protein